MSAGFITFALVYHISGNCKVSLGMSMVVGGVKEAYDKVSRKGHPDIKDFIFSALGGIIAYGVVK